MDSITHSPFVWHHPFTSIISGPTGCGKTAWVLNFIRHIKDLVNPTPTKIIYSYSEWQPAFQNLPSHVNLVQGLPSVPAYSHEPLLIILDDQMNETDQTVNDLFTKGSHHRNISIVYIIQNLFSKNKHHREISLNAHYLVIFKNPRDVSQIIHLAKQMFPGKTDYLKSAFTQATKQAHGYMIIDCNQNTPETLRLRSNFFPGETQKVFVPSGP